MKRLTTLTVVWEDQDPPSAYETTTVEFFENAIRSSLMAIEAVEEVTDVATISDEAPE